MEISTLYLSKVCPCDINLKWHRVIRAYSFRELLDAGDHTTQNKLF